MCCYNNNYWHGSEARQALLKLEKLPLMIDSSVLFFSFFEEMTDEFQETKHSQNTFQTSWHETPHLQIY